MANTIQNKHSNTASNVPGSVLALGEVALNHQDRKIFVRNPAGDANESLNAWINPDGAFEIPIFGGGSTIAAGFQFDFKVPFACDIVGWDIVGDQSGSVVIDLWKDTYANFPPTVADTITASAKPTVTTAVKAQSTTLTGWTVAWAKDDWIRLNIDSVSTFTRLILCLQFKRK